MRKINIEPDKLIEITNYYNNCKSLVETSLKFNISDETIRRRLNEVGVNTKLDIKSLRKKKIIYPIDESYFELINTPDKAYILGLLFADGCMYEFNGRKQIKLKLTDIDLLELVKEKMNYIKPLNNNKRKSDKHKHSKTLIICNGKIYDDLISLGCYKNKTFNCELPKLDDQYMGDFLRGFFDGDGCIYVGIDKRNNNITGEVVIVSTNDFIYDSIKYLTSHNINASYFRDKNHDERIGKFRIRQLDSLLKLFTLMYGNITNDSIYLDRKYNKYKQFLKDKNLL